MVLKSRILAVLVVVAQMAAAMGAAAVGADETKAVQDVFGQSDQGSFTA